MAQVFRAHLDSRALRLLARHSRGLMLLVALFSALGTGVLSAEEPVWRKQPRKVLDAFDVRINQRSILYERIQTPVLQPESAPVPATPGAVPSPPSAAELEEMQRWESLDYMNLSLGCTVYDGQWSEVQLWHDQGEVVFWTTIDFHLFTPMSELETKTSYYSMFLMIGESTRADFEKANAGYRRLGRRDLVRVWPTSLLQAARVSGQAQWRIVSPGPVPAAARQAIEDLHAHFQKNSRDMARRYAELQAAYRAQEEWARKNPPKPRNTRVEYFPIPASTGAPALPPRQP